MALRLETLKDGMPFEVQELCNDAIMELQRACEKHPLFPDSLIPNNKPAHDELLKGMREINARNGGQFAYGSSVFEEERIEMESAVLNGNYPEARKELVQSMAMLLRIYIHLEDYCRPV